MDEVFIKYNISIFKKAVGNSYINLNIESVFLISIRNAIKYRIIYNKDLNAIKI